MHRVTKQVFVFKLIDGRALARSPDWSGNTGFALDFPFGTRKNSA
jgi:hypothetical protein